MNFVKGSLFTIVSKAIMFFSSLFISIYIARILGPEAKGMYYILVQVVSIVVLLAMSGITSAAVYFAGKQSMPEEELCTQLFFLTILSGVLFFVLTKVSQGVLMKSVLKGIPAQYINIMIVAIPLLMLNQLFLSIILGLNRIVQFNILEIVCYFLLFLFFLIFTVGFHMGIYGVYFSFALTYLLTDCLFIALFIKKIDRLRI